MADVFISYSRAESALADRLVSALRESAFLVDWDYNFQIACGATLNDLIDERCASATCVLVLWSIHSVASPWVLKEATHGLARRRLLQVVLDGTEPPPEFRNYIYGDLSKWDGSTGDMAYKKIADGIKFFQGRARR